jgi:DNA (cytosine-5)-methyltransferase 1
VTSPTFVSLFSGIGGLDRAVEAHGFQVVAQVENDPHCLTVLGRHWPEVARYGDVKEIDWHGFLTRHGRPDLVAAGFPCQPTSQAGRRKAQEDPRWLWPEVARCLRALRPPYVFVENTLGLLARGFEDVLGDLAALGFDAEWDCLQAADVGAPHERDRVFVLAYDPAELAHAEGLGGALEPGHDPQGRHVAVAGAGGGAGGRGLAAGVREPGRTDPRRTADDVADPDGEHGTAGELERAAVGRLQLNGDTGRGDRAGQVADPSGSGWGANQRRLHGRQPDIAGCDTQVADAAGEGRGRPGSGREQGGRPEPAWWPQPGRLGEALEHPAVVGGQSVGRVEQPQDGDPQRLLHLGQPESRVGGDAPGLPAGLDGHRWPALPGPEQYPWEPPRTVGKGVPDRGRRVKALGNAVVPQQGALAFGLLWQRMEGAPGH